jgi:hypothetical protein
MVLLLEVSDGAPPSAEVFRVPIEGRCLLAERGGDTGEGGRAPAVFLGCSQLIWLFKKS